MVTCNPRLLPKKNQVYTVKVFTFTMFVRAITSSFAHLPLFQPLRSTVARTFTTATTPPTIASLAARTMSSPTLISPSDAPVVEATPVAAEVAGVKRDAEETNNITETTSVPEATTTSTETSQESGESAAKKQRVQIEKEDTSSYMGNKRNKVRGNIRGADKYKGKSRNAEDAAKAEAGEGSSAATEEGGDKEARIPKRKVAVMMGYCGTGYQGMQV